MLDVIAMVVHHFTIGYDHQFQEMFVRLEPLSPALGFVGAVGSFSFTGFYAEIKTILQKRHCTQIWIEFVSEIYMALTFIF